MKLVLERPAGVPLTAACRALVVNRSSVYARRRLSSLTPEQIAQRRSRRGCVQPRALSEQERDAIRDVLYAEALCVNMLSYTRRVRYRSGQGGDTRRSRDAQASYRVA